MTELFSAEMIKTDLYDEHRLERLPFTRARGGPAAGPARRVAGETGRRDQAFQLSREFRLFRPLDGRGETEVIEAALVIVQPEQQRAHDRFSFVVAETADDAVRAAIIFDLLHPATVPGAVGQVAPLGDDTVERGTHAVEPSLGFDELACCRREANASGTAKILGSKEIELSPPLGERQIDERLAITVKQEIKSDEERRRLLRELVHAALRGMNAVE